MQGRESLNRAINGDIVAVRLFPESEWSAPANLVIEDYGINFYKIYFLNEITNVMCYL